MKIAATIIRILLGLIFLVFGLNGFLNFIPAPPLTGVVAAFIGALASSHYLMFVCGVQVVSGILLLINQFVPLALILIAPVIVNILVFHLTMQLSGLPPALVITGLWIFLASRLRATFAPLLVRKVALN